MIPTLIEGAAVFFPQHSIFGAGLGLLASQLDTIRPRVNQRVQRPVSGVNRSVIHEGDYTRCA